jgi:hypothetical protein
MSTPKAYEMKEKHVTTVLYSGVLIFSKYFASSEENC